MIECLLGAVCAFAAVIVNATCAHHSQSSSVNLIGVVLGNDPAGLIRV